MCIHTAWLVTHSLSAVVFTLSLVASWHAVNFYLFSMWNMVVLILKHIQNTYMKNPPFNSLVWLGLAQTCPKYVICHYNVTHVLLEKGSAHLGNRKHYMYPLPETPFTIVANDTAFSQNTKSSEPHIVNLTVESFTDEILSHTWSATH